MRIVLIGAGRLATHLGKALIANGHQVTAVYSRTMASALSLTDVIGGMATDSIAALPVEADAFILSVKDSALESLIPPLCEGREGQLLLHTAGSVPMSIFKNYARRYGVLYPLQTFSKEREVDFGEIPIFIEGSDPTIQALAVTLSTHVRQLSSEDRRLLHLAAVFASNFVNHCYALSADVLERCGLPFSVMLPLIDETARKVHQLHPLQAQTGPAVRYDENIISQQAALLSDLPLTQQLYQLLSQSIHKHNL